MGGCLLHFLKACLCAIDEGVADIRGYAWILRPGEQLAHFFSKELDCLQANCDQYSINLDSLTAKSLSLHSFYEQSYLLPLAWAHHPTPLP